MNYFMKKHWISCRGTMRCLRIAIVSQLTPLFTSNIVIDTVGMFGLMSDDKPFRRMLSK